MNGFEGYARITRVAVTQVMGHCPVCDAELLFGYDEIIHGDGPLRRAQLADAYMACEACGEMVDCSKVAIWIDEGRA